MAVLLYLLKLAGYGRLELGSEKEGLRRALVVFGGLPHTTLEYREIDTNDIIFPNREAVGDLLSLYSYVEDVALILRRSR